MHADLTLLSGSDDRKRARYKRSMRFRGGLVAGFANGTGVH